ncbi:nucleotide disphospho-sugar-binding domain-containing protein [Streptomyces sp. NPDC101151]|uniref:nucleotide disphospho-sugar-binding domain-containing protein n=1 Tax=Streptomyces sp. NPDC101151 TaxID=3366115 RepID=UPI00380C85DC
MKILFTVGGSQATVFGVAPLATAARNAGHEILLAADEPLMEAAEAIGLPAVSITPERMRHGQDSVTASGRLDALLNLAEDWPPDLVIGALSHVPRLLAAHREIPYVRQVWYIDPMGHRDRRAVEELRPELKRLRLAELPDPALFIDVCPPSLRPPLAPDAQPMRWIPRNRQRRLEPWMYTRPEGRHRVLITSGTRSLMLDTAGSSLRNLVDRLTGEGAEVLIAAPEEAAEKFGAELGDVRIGWIPLDVVAPTCDLAVHHGGATTATTLTHAGVPQLITPDNGYGKAVAQALSGFGAALMVTPQQLGPGQDPDEAVAAGCREVLSTPRYAQQAQALAKEIATLPTPSEVVHTLETLAVT